MCYYYYYLYMRTSLENDRKELSRSFGVKRVTLEPPPPYFVFGPLLLLLNIIF